MKWFVLFVVLLFGLWHGIDLDADSVFASAIAPIAFTVVSIVFLVWLSIQMARQPTSSAGGSGSASSGGFFGGGSDSFGGGDGGCGGGGDGGC